MLQHQHATHAHQSPTNRHFLQAQQGRAIQNKTKNTYLSTNILKNFIKKKSAELTMSRKGQDRKSNWIR